MMSQILFETISMKPIFRTKKIVNDIAPKPVRKFFILYCIYVSVTDDVDVVTDDVSKKSNLFFLKQENSTTYF